MASFSNSRDLKPANEDGNANVGFFVILVLYFNLVFLCVSIFAEILLTPASPSERNGS